MISLLFAFVLLVPDRSRTFLQRCGNRGCYSHGALYCSRPPLRRDRFLSRWTWNVRRMSSGTSLSHSAGQTETFMEASTGEQEKGEAEGVALLKDTGLSKLVFKNTSLKRLPIDSEAENYVRQVKGACFSRVRPDPLRSPKIVCFSKSALNLIGLQPEDTQHELSADVFSGKLLLPGSEPSAHCYCGHQFGVFAGQLGDGAAMYLGEVVRPDGDKWEIQLKGAGKTPYSRSADGRKVLRSSIREFLCSEHFHGLNVPSTRAATCVTSDTKVPRDVNYNGNTKLEKASVVTRIARTFIRFGSFEIFKLPDDDSGFEKGPSAGRTDILKRLLSFVIESYFPRIWEKHRVVLRGDSEDDKKDMLSTDMVADFLEEIVRRTAKLASLWQCIGWCHGVLNTDNMSIIGDTIDYGPFSFMEAYKADFVCNGSDNQGRYAYESQPSVCKWNCSKLAEALSPVLPPSKSKDILNLFDDVFEDSYIKTMRKKLGLIHSEQTSDKKLVEELLLAMGRSGADWTCTFRNLREVTISDCVVSDNNSATGDRGCADSNYGKAFSLLSAHFATPQKWRELHRPNISPQAVYFALQVCSSLGVTPAPLQELRRQLSKFDEVQKLSDEDITERATTSWTEWLRKYVARLQEDYRAAKDKKLCEDMQTYECHRRLTMDKVNPKIVLRNHIAERAIQRAEQGDFSEVQRLTEVMMRPYDDDHRPEDVAPRPNDMPFEPLS